jgi:hypothetical protein
MPVAADVSLISLIERSVDPDYPNYGPELPQIQ